MITVILYVSPSYHLCELQNLQICVHYIAYTIVVSIPLGLFEVEDNLVKLYGVPQVLLTQFSRDSLIPVSVSIQMCVCVFLFTCKRNSSMSGK